jgi:UMF1 family MFS transporter
MVSATLKATTTRRERWAWYLYDFGNSAYAAVVLLAIYSRYFQEGVVGGEEGSRLWGIAVGIAMLVVAISAPVLGTIADLSGAKKRFLLFYTAMAVTFCGLLFFVQRGNVVLGVVLFVLAEIGYRSAQVFYNSLLPEIAEPGEMPRVSGNGWAIGSMGGIICLILVLVPIMLTNSSNLVIRLSLVFTALYFAVSALPVFLWLQERAQPQALPPGESYLTLAFRRLARTFRAVRSFREFVKFIVAFLIYNDGILMILDFGAILGGVLYGMNETELIVFMILVQVASVAGAYLFGILANDHGSKRSLVLALVLTIVPVAWLYFSFSKFEFYLIGCLAGFALTGVQSVSRTMVATFSPPGQSAEFYGFFAVAGRTSSFIGPTIFGILAAETTQWYERARGLTGLAAEQAGHRVALFSIAAFLVAGLLLLLSVNQKRTSAGTELVGEASN